MNKNGIKILIVVLCLGLAGFMVARQMGLFGSSRPAAVAGATTNPDGSPAAPASKVDGEEAPNVGTLKPDRY